MKRLPIARAGVRELKDHLGEYLRRVRSGERIVITDRGRPVAALVGIEEQPAEEVAWSIVRQGFAEWNGGKPEGLPEGPRVRGRRAEEVVLEDRR